MFTWLNKQGVQSDEGFALQFVGRFTAEYSEAGKVMTLAVEDAFVDGKPAVKVSPASLTTWRGEVVPLSNEARDRIVENVRRACEYQGLQFVFGD